MSRLWANLAVGICVVLGGVFNAQAEEEQSVYAWLMPVGVEEVGVDVYNIMGREVLPHKVIHRGNTQTSVSHATCYQESCDERLRVDLSQDFKSLMNGMYLVQMTYDLGQRNDVKWTSRVRHRVSPSTSDLLKGTVAENIRP